MIKNILILAAGDSTRFWPLKSKDYTPFLGKPLINHIASALSPYCDKIIAVVNPQDRDKISDVETVVQEKTEEGQAGAVLAAKDKLTGDVLVLNANDVFDFKAIEQLVAAKKQFSFLAKKTSHYFPGGYVRFNNEKIIGIVEKPGAGNEPSDVIKLVADYFSDGRFLVSAIESTSAQNDDWYEQALSKIISDGASVEHVLYEGEWVTIKYPWHVLTMMNNFLSTITQTSMGENVHISKNAIIEGPVMIGNNVKIGDFAKIIGPVYIGDDTIIANYAMVRASHIGKNVLIGGYTEVTRSYLSDNVMLHRNYVGDSVLDENVLMGAGAITANFRFDARTVRDTNLKKFGAVLGRDVKVGVQTTLTPGVKIGSNTFIGPLSLVDHDIQENQFFYKGELKENKI